MHVYAHPGEPFESLLRRFVRGVQASGVLGEARRRRHFIPNHEERREKIRRARRRLRRASSADQMGAGR